MELVPVDDGFASEHQGDRLEVRQREFFEPLQTADRIAHRAPSIARLGQDLASGCGEGPARRVKTAPPEGRYELSVRSGRGAGAACGARPSDSVPKKIARVTMRTTVWPRRTPEEKNAKGVSAARYS